MNMGYMLMHTKDIERKISRLCFVLCHCCISFVSFLFSYSNYILELLDLALSFLQTALSLITMTFYDLSLSSSSSAASLNLFLHVLLRES